MSKMKGVAKENQRRIEEMEKRSATPMPPPPPPPPPCQQEGRRNWGSGRRSKGIEEDSR
jgi:hypothetical protein